MPRYFNINNGPSIGRHCPSYAHTEQRPALLKEMKRSRMGIYRPLDKDSQEEVVQYTTNAVEGFLPDVIRQRTEKPLGQFVVKQDLGVTFLSQKNFRKRKNKIDLFMGGFRLHRELERIQKEVWQPQEEPPLPVDLDLDHLEWEQSRGRSLLIFFDDQSDGYKQLEEERDCIASIIGEFSTKMATAVKVPNHLTVLQYGQYSEKNQLGWKEKKMIADKVSAYLSESGLCCVFLDPVVAGGESDPTKISYRNTLPEWDQAVQKQKQIRA